MTAELIIPDFLTHYYEKSAGPFSNLSMLSFEHAEQILEEIRKNGNRFASQRPSDYMRRHFALEAKIRALFERKGGIPKLARPHYMSLGICPWLKTWYMNGQELQIKLDNIPENCLSFTYGDSFPAMNYNDGKPYRGQVYTRNALAWLIERYRLPQVWNPDGKAALSATLKHRFGMMLR